MIWRCLQGGDEKCSHNLSRGSANLMQPKISSMFWIFLIFVSISAEGMGEDSYLNVRSCNQHMPGRHTFQIMRVSESIPAKACSFSFFIADLRSPTVLLFSMLTGKVLLDLWRTQQKSLNLSSEPIIEWFRGLTTYDCLPLWDRSDRLESIDQVEVIVVEAD